MTLETKALTAFDGRPHDRIAGCYAAVFAPLTSLALDPLLDAARAGSG